MATKTQGARSRERTQALREYIDTHVVVIANCDRRKDDDDDARSSRLPISRSVNRPLIDNVINPTIESRCAAEHLLIGRQRNESVCVFALSERRRCLPTSAASESTSAAPTHPDRTQMLFPAATGARSNSAGAIQAKFIRDIITRRKSVSRHIDIYRVVTGL